MPHAAPNPETSSPETMTFAEHAEAWWSESGHTVPRADTPEWREMYETWVEWAFQDMEVSRG